MIFILIFHLRYCFLCVIQRNYFFFFIKRNLFTIFWRMNIFYTYLVTSTYLSTIKTSKVINKPTKFGLLITLEQQNKICDLHFLASIRKSEKSFFYFLYIYKSSLPISKLLYCYWTCLLIFFNSEIFMTKYIM